MRQNDGPNLHRPAATAVGRWLLALLGIGALALAASACGSSGRSADAKPLADTIETSPGQPASREFFGGRLRAADGTPDVLAAMVSDGSTFLAYLCDGETTSAWFKGAVAADGAIEVTNKAGRTLRGRLVDHRFDGRFIEVNGIATEVSLEHSDAPTLHRLEQPGALTGWVTVGDQQTGATESGTTVTPAPPLDTTTGSTPIASTATVPPATNPPATTSPATTTPPTTPLATNTPPTTPPATTSPAAATTLAAASATTTTPGATTTTPGATTTTSRPASTTSTSTTGCAAGNVLRLITDRLAAGQPPSIVLGDIATINLGTVATSGPCNDNASVGFSGGTVSLFGGTITGTGMAGTVDRFQGCFSAGQLSTRPEWKLPSVPLNAADPLCIRWQQEPAAPGTNPPTIPPNLKCRDALGGGVSGSLVWSDKFPQLVLPGGITPRETKLSFDCTTARWSARADGGAGVLTVAGTGNITGDYDLTVTADAMPLLGGTFNGTGRMAGTRSASTEARLTGTLANASTGLPGVEIKRLTIDLTPQTAALRGAIGFAGKQGELNVSGSFNGPEDWQLDAVAGTAAGAQPLTLLPNLDLTKAAFTGSLKRLNGATTFSFSGGVTGQWQPIDQLTVTSLTATVANTTPPKAGTESICVLTNGETWANATGTGVLALGNGAPPITIAVSGCIGVQSGSFKLASTATFNSWRPFADLDASLEKVGIRVEQPNGQPMKVTVLGTAKVRQQPLEGKAVFIAPSTLVLDASGSLDAVAPGLSGAGHVLATNATVTSYDTGDPKVGVLTLQPGLTAVVGQTLDNSSKQFLSGSLGIANLNPNVLAIGQISTNGDVSLEARIALGPDGVRLFRMCPPGKATCIDDEATEVRLGTLGIAATAVPPGLKLQGQGTLLLPKPRPQDNRPILEITVAGTYKAPSEIGFELSVRSTNGAWQDAFGIPGLGVNGLAFEVAATVNPPNGITPTKFAVLGDVQSFPQFMVDALGIVGSGREHARVAFKISATEAPIFEFTLGEPTAAGATRVDYLKPIKFYVPARQDDLKVDVASLVFAPLGGKIGVFTYEPGVNLLFRATILGTDVDVKAIVDLTAPSISAHMNVSPITVNGLKLDQTKFDLDAAIATGFSAGFSGGVTLPNNGPQLAATVQGTATLADGLRFHADSTGKAWTLAPGVVVNNFALDTDAALTSLSAPPTAALKAKGNATLFGTSVVVNGNLVTSGGTVQKFDFTGGTSPITVGTTKISGAGCPAGTGPAGQPTDGPCVSIGYDDTVAAPKGSLEFDGAVTANGLDAKVHGIVNGTRAALSGTLDTGNFGRVTVNGTLYSAAATTTETDHKGVAHTIAAGDWKVSAAARATLVRGFNSNLAFTGGKLGTTQWVHGSGTSKIGESTVSVSGLIAKQGAGVNVVPSTGTITSPLPTGVLVGTVRRPPTLGTVNLSITPSLVPINTTFTGTVKPLPARTVPAPPTKPIDGRTSTAPVAVVVPVSRLAVDPRFTTISNLSPVLLNPNITTSLSPRLATSIVTVTAPTGMLPASGTAVVFDFIGDADLVLGGVSLADAHVELRNDLVRASARLNITGLASSSGVAGTATLAGDLSVVNNALQFKLEGEADLKETTSRFGTASGSSLHGKFTLTQTGLDAILEFHTAFLDVELAGELTTSGSLCLSGDADLTSIDANLDVSFCNSGTNAGLRGSGKIGEFTFAGVLKADGYSLTASVPATSKAREVVVMVADNPVIVVGATISYQLDGTLTQSAMSVTGSGTASVYTRWPDSSTKSTLASVGASVDTKRAQACAVLQIDVPTQGARRVSLCSATT